MKGHVGRTRWIASCLSLVFAAHAFAGSPLAYRLSAGDRFQIDTVTDASAPVVGPIHAVVKAQSEVVSATPDAMVLKESITSQIAGKPDYTLENLGITVSPEGKCSNITGVDMNDPKQALIAKNASVGLPPLPNEPVDVGSTWEDERPIFLPHVPVPGIPASVRVHSTYKVTGLGKTGDKDTASIAVTSSEAPGEKVKLEATGSLVVELATGKPVTSHLEGLAQVRVILKTLKVPFKVDITVH